MPHVSSKKLTDKVYLRIYREFTRAIIPRGGSKAAVLNDILTETEKIMLAKRLAVVNMLDEGYSPFLIEKHLHISTSTVRRIHSDMMDGEYSSLVNMKKTSSKKRNFWLSMFIALMDPRLIASANRTKIFDEHFK